MKITRVMQRTESAVPKTFLVAILAAFAVNANVITVENARAGSSDWTLTTPNTASNIVGYCHDMSVTAGGTMKVYVNTSPAAQYTARIYRMGYYGGAGARLMATYGPVQGVSYAAPSVPYENLYECVWPNGGFDIAIGADWVSGVYLGKLTRQDNGQQSYVYFVVRDTREADIMVKVSDFNWHAYNPYGAGSLYNSASGGTYSFNVRVSLDRPVNHSAMFPMSNQSRMQGSGEFLSLEWPMIYVLEQRGYDVTYISCMDAHTGNAAFSRVLGMFTIGHDEYWTTQMYTNVQNAVNAGMGAAFMSGNATFCYIALSPSLATGRADRTIKRSAMVNTENQLMGTKTPSQFNDYGDFICTMPNHWIYAGTGMVLGDRITNLIGWEMHDGSLKNDPTMVVWSQNRPTGTWPALVWGGRYQCTEYRAPVTGQPVISGSTCWWVSHMGPAPGHINHGAYDTDPDAGAFPSDERVNKMTTNICDKWIEIGGSTAVRREQSAPAPAAARRVTVGVSSEAFDIRGRAVRGAGAVGVAVCPIRVI